VALLNGSGLRYARLGGPPPPVRPPSHRRYRSYAEGQGQVPHMGWGFGLYIGLRHPNPNGSLPWRRLGWVGCTAVHSCYVE
jgi:hypothetical protein